MAKRFWSIQQTEQVTNLYILHEIAAESSWWVDTVTPQDFRSALFGVRGELHVWLDSPGGDAFAGAAIHDMLREYSAAGRGKTVAMVSLAASAASLIAMACDEIRISVVGTMMIHEPWGDTRGKASELRATADVLDSVREAQIDAYARRSGQTREKVTELMQGPDGNGTYMNAAQALELGFADSIMHADGEADQDSALAASASSGFARSMMAARVQSCLEHTASSLQAAMDAKAADDKAAQAETDEKRVALLRACLNTYENEMEA